MMMMKFQEFKELHHTAEPLILGNVWNVQSAKVYQKLGYKAIGTSSAAVAHSLGYDDGENMPFAEYLFVIKRIAASTSMPLTVDMEAGYGNDVNAIFENIRKLHQLGVVGVNLEDSTVANGLRTMEPAAEFSSKLEQLVLLLKENGLDVFINVRCDVFLLGLTNAVAEALKRVKLYESKSIDGIFLPGITNENEIKRMVESTSLPINVMCMPALPDFERLKSLGVKRISMGNFVNDCIYRKMEEVCDFSNFLHLPHFLFR